MPRELAIILNHGSLNDAVATALAAQKHRIVMVLAETGPAPGRVAQAFDQQVQHFKPYRSHRAPMPFVATLGRNDTRAASADPRSSQSLTHRLTDLVPVIAAGARYASHYDATALYIGLRVGPEGDDLARVTEFTQVWSELLCLSNGQSKLELVLPIAELEPWQVIDLGVQVTAPLGLSWTCDNLTGEPCGACPPCREREAAFIRSGRPDPAKAQTRKDSPRRSPAT